MKKLIQYIKKLYQCPRCHKYGYDGTECIECGYTIKDHI